MQSVIFQYVDQRGDEYVSIGNVPYFQKTRKTCKQIINIMSRNHSEEDREVIMQSEQEDLYRALINTIKKNTLHVFYPN